MLDFSKTKLSATRSIWSYHKVQLLRSAISRGRPRFMNLKKAGLYLDVGCGPSLRPQNINLDYHWRPGVDICCDVANGLPLPDSYVAGIYSEHCLEHVSLRSMPFILREFFRVLQPGAFIRIIVPDLEIYVIRYNEFLATGEHSMPYAADDPTVDGVYTPAMTFNRIMHDLGHQFIYDFPTLAKLLAAVGFATITKTKFGVGSDAALLMDAPEREIESLYVEARKLG
jgi:predicted SAM-dependent methyltransferase